MPNYKYNIEVQTKVNTTQLTTLSKKLETLQKRYKTIEITPRINNSTTKTLEKQITQVKRMADQLETSLSKTRMNKGVTSSVQSLTKELRNANTQAQKLKSTLNQIKSVNAKVNVSSSGTSTRTGSTFNTRGTTQTNTRTIITPTSSRTTEKNTYTPDLERSINKLDQRIADQNTTRNKKTGTTIDEDRRSKDSNFYVNKATPTSKLSTDYANIGSKGSSFREKMGNVGDLALGMTGLIGMTGLKGYLYDTPVKADTNKFVVQQMGDEQVSGTQLYNTIDQVTNQLPISMQSVVQPLKAFQAATGASASDINAITGQFANLGAQVINLTGSEELATTAMEKLGRGFQGEFAALDQYGITKETLSKHGWNADDEDDQKNVKKYMQAVTEVVGDAKDSMMTFNGQSQQFSKNLSIAGKTLWELNQIPLTGGLAIVNGLDSATSGVTTTLGLFVAEIASLGTTAIGAMGYISQFTSSLADFMLYTRQVKQNGGLKNTFKLMWKGILGKDIDDELIRTMGGADSYYLNGGGSTTKSSSSESTTKSKTKGSFVGNLPSYQKEWDKQTKDKKTKKAQRSTTGYKNDSIINIQSKDNEIFKDSRNKYAKALRDNTVELNSNKSRFKRNARGGFSGLRTAFNENSNGGVRSNFNKGTGSGIKSLFTGLGGSVAQLGTMFTSLGSVINPLTLAFAGLLIAVPLISGIFTHAYNSSQQVRDQVNLLKARLGVIGQELKFSLGNIFKSIGLSIEGGTKGFDEGLINTVSGIIHILNSIAEGVSKLAGYDFAGEAQREIKQDSFESLKKEYGLEEKSTEDLLNEGAIALTSDMRDAEGVVDNRANYKGDLTDKQLQTLQNAFAELDYYNADNINGYYPSQKTESEKQPETLSEKQKMNKEHGAGTTQAVEKYINEHPEVKPEQAYQLMNSGNGWSQYVESFGLFGDDQQVKPASFTGQSGFVSGVLTKAQLKEQEKLSSAQYNQNAGVSASSLAKDNPYTQRTDFLNSNANDILKKYGNDSLYDSGVKDVNVVNLDDLKSDETDTNLNSDGRSAEKITGGSFSDLFSGDITTKAVGWAAKNLVGNYGKTLGISFGDSSDKQSSSAQDTNTNAEKSTGTEESNVGSASITIGSGTIEAAGLASSPELQSAYNAYKGASSSNTGASITLSQPSSSQVQQQSSQQQPAQQQQNQQGYAPQNLQIDTSSATQQVQTSLSQSIQQGVNQGFVTLNTTLNTQGAGLSSVGTTMGTNLTNGFNTGIGNLTSQIQSKVAQIPSTINGQQGAVRQAGSSLGQAATDGFRSGLGDISGIASQEFADVAAAIRAKIPDIEAASAEAGAAMESGFTGPQGNNNRSPGNVYKAARYEWNAVLSKIGEYITPIYDTSAKAGRSMAEGYSTTSSIAPTIAPTIASNNIVPSSDGLNSIALASADYMRTGYKNNINNSKSGVEQSNTPVNVTNHFDVASIDSKDRVQEVAEGVVKVLRFNNETAGRLDSNTTGAL